MSACNAKLKADGADVPFSTINKVSFPNDNLVGNIGCVGGVMKEITCKDGWPSQSGPLFFCIHGLVTSNKLDDFKIPDAADCGGTDYSAAGSGECSIAVKAGGDCGTCTGGGGGGSILNSGTPVKSIGVVAIIALIAMLL